MANLFSFYIIVEQTFTMSHKHCKFGTETVRFVLKHLSVKRLEQWKKCYCSILLSKISLC